MTKGEVFEKYVELIRFLRRTPEYSEFARVGLTRDTIRHHWGTVGAVELMARQIYPELFGDVALENATKDSSSLGGHRRRYVVTTAVVGCSVYKPFLDTLRAYCRRNDAELLILVSADPASRKSPGGFGYIDAELQSEHVIGGKGVDLNDCVHLSTAKMSAKQIDPTTGLGRLAHGLAVYASPKQRWAPVASPDPATLRAVATTGACTLPAYESDRFMSLRTAHLAEKDHRIGAIVIEIVDDKRFHARHIQCRSDDGSFFDLGTRYSMKRTDKLRTSALVLGDLHAGHTAVSFIEALPEIASVFRPFKIVIHDLFNGTSTSPHDKDRAITLAQKSDLLSLAQEGKIVAEALHMVAQYTDQVVVVKSNHDEWLERWLEAGRFQNEPQNYRLALELAAAMHDGKDPLTELVKRFDPPRNVTWLKRDESHKIAGIECGHHGHRGPNGSRGAPNNLEASLVEAVTGHTHTPLKLRGLTTVGTSTELREKYTAGPSSWRQALAPVYSDGATQIVDHTHGLWRM